LYLLFPAGKRPTSARLRDVVSSLERLTISHEPSSVGGGSGGPGWVELLRDGMTFDLTGLPPGDAPPLPAIEHRFDCPEDLLESRKSALRLAPGPHLAAGAKTLPVVRTMAGAAADLVAALPDVPAVAWAPSGSLIGRGFFVSTVEAWLAGGPFPALGFTAFRPTLDDALQSVGLTYFTGQELRIEPALAADRAAATRLGVRLVNMLVGLGPLKAGERVTGLDGAPLRLDPSPNGRYVRIYPA
jgi:hypothetical protein